MPAVTALTKDEATALVTRLSRELAELRSKLVDLDAWSLERIHDQERIIAELRQTNEKLRDLVKRTLGVD